MNHTHHISTEQQRRSQNQEKGMKTTDVWFQNLWVPFKAVASYFGKYAYLPSDLGPEDVMSVFPVNIHLGSVWPRLAQTMAAEGSRQLALSVMKKTPIPTPKPSESHVISSARKSGLDPQKQDMEQNDLSVKSAH